jgi:glycine hydroxymethyltransferase
LSQFVFPADSKSAGDPANGGSAPAEPIAPALPTVLYQEHLRLTSKARLAPFAGYLMPLWYSSISAEHHVVRCAAGIFDCTHMGVMQIEGPDAAGFLNLATTNDIGALGVGQAQYSYILDAAGNVLDDIIVYRRSEDKYMLVVNAANTPKIKAYLQQLAAGELIIDIDQPDKLMPYRPIIHDLTDPGSGTHCRVDIALQGPASNNILLSLVDRRTLKDQISALKSFHFLEGRIQGMDCLISRTGYTGSKVGFELFIHPKNAPRLWNLLLEAGSKLGLLPCGLGARDSLRIEAGLPLYGHELAGMFNISPFEAGYGWAVKLQKDFFIGKAPIRKIAEAHTMQVARLELPGEKGIRPVRQNDPVLNGRGKCIGWVLSCANAPQLSSSKSGDKQITLSYLARESAFEQSPIGIYYLARSENQIGQGRRQNVELGQTIEPDLTGIIVSRFAKFA